MTPEAATAKKAMMIVLGTRLPSVKVGIGHVHRSWSTSTEFGRPYKPLQAFGEYNN